MEVDSPANKQSSSRRNGNHVIGQLPTADLKHFFGTRPATVRLRAQRREEDWPIAVRLVGNEEGDMSTAPIPLTRPEEWSGSGSLPKVTTLVGLTESIAKELNECLSGIVINASTCLRMLSADPPNVEGARETARWTICCSNRAAEAVSHLRTLFSEANKRIETVAPSREEASRVAPGGTL